jgi:hypothetical protein
MTAKDGAMPDIGETLQRKIGPLPVWAWGGVVGGGLLIAKTLTGGGGGASSPFVQPLAGGAQGAIDFADDVGSSGGGGGGGGGSTPAPNPVAAISQRLSLTGSTPIVDRTGKVIGTLKSGTFDVVKESFNGRTYWKITSVGASSGTTYTGGYIHATSNPTYTLAGGTGDTGDATPLASSAPVPFSSPIPLGSRLALPEFSPIASRYTGPSIDALTPIASGARIALPSINGGPTGPVRPAILPDSDAARRFSPTRIIAPVRARIDAVIPSRLPTTRPQTPFGDIFRIPEWREWPTIIARRGGRADPSG